VGEERMNQWEELSLEAPPDLTKSYHYKRWSEEKKEWRTLWVANLEALYEVEFGNKILYKEAKNVTFYHECPECGYTTRTSGLLEWCEACGWGDEPLEEGGICENN
jgi:rubrerythrin